MRQSIPIPALFLEINWQMPVASSFRDITGARTPGLITGSALIHLT